MGFDVSVVSTHQAFRALREQWQELVSDQSEKLLGLDGTATYDWFEAICAAFSQAGDARLVVVREGGEVVGLLPIICEQGNARWPRLKAPTELYGGRVGLLVRRFDADLTSAVMKGLTLAHPGWTSFQITLVSGSESALALEQWSRDEGFALVSSDARESPYFPICETAEAFQAGISKGLRQLLRTSANKFRALGELKHRQMREEGQSAELIEIVLDIERKSWKHEAGSAITNNPQQERFYRELFPRAMRQGLLLGHVLSLDDTPIAYNFGLRRDGVFSCLKHSHVQSMDKLSPSYLLNLALIDSLRADGVRTYDFMGLPDPHKIRWSNATQTYSRACVFVFNRNLAGRLAFQGQRIKKKLAGISQREQAGARADSVAEE